MSCDSLSIRQRVFEILRRNPYYKAKYICNLIGLDYRKHGPYINKLKSDFHSYYKIGLPQKPHRRVFVWECVPRELFRECFEKQHRKIESEQHFVAALKAYGWVQPVGEQRNPFWVYRGAHGSVHWYKSGKVILYLRGNLMLARVKELFCKAFSFLPKDMLLQYLDAPIREESRHMIFNVDGPMPRFDIRYYEKTHGLRVFTDGSHPQALEVVETTPFWIQDFGEVVQQFGGEIKAHMELIKEWQKEAKLRREQQGFWKKIKGVFGFRT